MTFERLFAFLVLGHGRRQLLWFEVTLHPTAEWLASAPAYLVRDNDRAYGDVLKSRASAPKTPFRLFEQIVWSRSVWHEYLMP